MGCVVQQLRPCACRHTPPLQSGAALHGAVPPLLPAGVANGGCMAEWRRHCCAGGHGGGTSSSTAGAAAGVCSASGAWHRPLQQRALLTRARWLPRTAASCCGAAARVAGAVRLAPTLLRHATGRGRRRTQPPVLLRCVLAAAARRCQGPQASGHRPHHRGGSAGVTTLQLRRHWVFWRERAAWAGMLCVSACWPRCWPPPGGTALLGA